MKVKVTTMEAGEDLEKSDEGESGDEDLDTTYLYYADGSVRFPCPVYNADGDRRYGGHILPTDPYAYD
jgi:hypothetical protein